MKLKSSILITVALMLVPLLSFSQYFQGLYDVDSSQEGGWDIFLQNDSSYFVYGLQINTITTDRWGLFNMQVTADGNTVLNKHIFTSDGVNLFIGIPGEIKFLSGAYIAPFTAQYSYDTNYRSWAGILKYDISGNAVLIKTYTDTSVYYDALSTCAVMPDGGYILGGGHRPNPSLSYPGYIIRTDSIGDTLWTKTYLKIPSENVTVNNLISLPDGRIATASISISEEYISGYGNIDHNSPWFMVLDSLGNIQKDTLYGSPYTVGTNGICGELYNDNNGGYINIGVYDSLLVPSDPTDARNFPCYIAHLDTNFRITWITEFPYTEDQGHRQPVIVRQLHDGSYMVVGDDWSDSSAGYDRGFAAKISRTGEIIWSDIFISDTDHNAYLRDMVEKPDGSLVFTGQTFNDTLPTWHQHADMWLVGTDSNGCEQVNCGITGIKNVLKPATPSFSVYPNPTNGSVSVATNQSGTFEVYTIVGQLVSSYAIAAGNTAITLPANLANGIYMGEFKPDNGGLQKTVHLAYQP